MDPTLFLIMIVIGVANLILCISSLVVQGRINSDTIRGLERLNRRLKDLEAKERSRQ